MISLTPLPKLLLQTDPGGAAPAGAHPNHIRLFVADAAGLAAISGGCIVLGHNADRPSQPAAALRGAVDAVTRSGANTRSFRKSPPAGYAVLAAIFGRPAAAFGEMNREPIAACISAVATREALTSRRDPS